MKGTASTAGDVLVSIRPEFANKILDGFKTIELRRRFPTTATTGALVLIYSSTPEQAIVGYAKIKTVERMLVSKIRKLYLQDACIEGADFDKYFRGVRFGYAIFLGGVKRLPRKVPVSDLKKLYGFVPPQSFSYVSERYDKLLMDERIQIPHRYKRRNRS
jgi:predicted transcriptional regulator